MSAVDSFNTVSAMAIHLFRMLDPSVTRADQAVAIINDYPELVYNLTVAYLIWEGSEYTEADAQAVMSAYKLIKSQKDGFLTTDFEFQTLPEDPEDPELQFKFQRVN